MPRLLEVQRTAKLGVVNMATGPLVAADGCVALGAIQLR